MPRELMDDGENRAVRAFLMHYGSAGLSVGQMKYNLRTSGFDGCWPAWCDEPGEDKQHLTKGGAQLWLRHLFALEGNAGVPDAPTVDLTKPHWRCVCGTVAMPLTDETHCKCSDIYEQQWVCADGDGVSRTGDPTKTPPDADEQKGRS